MATYNIHAGHCPQGKGASGAVGLLNESIEDRLVKNELIRLLRLEGHTVYDCTVDYKTTQTGCLRDIVKMCNQHSVNLDVSIHLNSGRNDYSGDGNTGGTEVFNYDTRTKAISDRICANISSALGIRNRGTKYSKNLYVLNNTKNLAILIECCFVDDKDDAARWNYKKCAKAIAEGILGHSISSLSDSNSSSSASSSTSLSSKPTVTSSSPKIDVKYQTYTGKWLSDITNYNTTDTNGYAGILGKSITGLRANTVGEVSKVGNLKYRVHTKGGTWLDWVTDRQKDKNGDNYAGILGKTIDGVQMTLANAPAERKVKYRVHILGGSWLSWVTNYGNGSNGYAGVLGKSIDAIQIQII